MGGTRCSTSCGGIIITECSDLPNACNNAGQFRCEDSWEECLQNDEGCYVWTDSGNMCNSNEDYPPCPTRDGCMREGDDECTDGDSRREECVVVSPREHGHACLEWDSDSCIGGCSSGNCLCDSPSPPSSYPHPPDITCDDLATNQTSSAFVGGSGTEADPYLVANAVQLARLSGRSHFKLVNDIMLVEDRRNNHYDYRRNSLIQGFEGSFDGDGHTICNVENDQYYTLFYTLNRAKVSNVLLNNLILAQIVNQTHTNQHTIIKSVGVVNETTSLGGVDITGFNSRVFIVRNYECISYKN